MAVGLKDQLLSTNGKQAVEPSPADAVVYEYHAHLRSVSQDLRAAINHSKALLERLNKRKG